MFKSLLPALLGMRISAHIICIASLLISSEILYFNIFTRHCSLYVTIMVIISMHVGFYFISIFIISYHKTLHFSLHILF